jgi:hypothetical protein
MSKWASSSFIIHKKDHTVRTISDFRELNKCIVSKPYPIPKISNTLQELEGFTYATNFILKHGLLYHHVRPHSCQDVHYLISLGQILVSKIANGICRIG